MSNTPTPDLALFLHNPLPMWVYALSDQRFLEVNHAATRKYGFSRDEFLSMTIFDIRTDDDRDRLRRNLESDRAALERSGPWRHRRKDGTELEVRITSHTLSYRDCEAVLVVVNDVTEQMRTERAQKLEAIGRLAGSVAHDFNNLLTVMLGNCHFLGAGLRLDDPLREHLLVIERAAKSASAMTRQLLAFSRPQIVQAAVLDTNRVISDTSLVLKRLIGDHITLTLRLDPKVANIEADQSQIEQILINLVVNGRDAMPNGGTITIATGDTTIEDAGGRAQADTPPGRYVQLSVSDSGMGMTPAVQARAFEPFFSTKGDGAGMGLGLASVHGIVTQNGGTVAVKSDVGRGTTFTVHWPATERPLSPILPVQPSTVATGTILVVEDHPAVRQMTSQALMACGYMVLEAASGEAALQIAKQTPHIDLLLTDVVMPGLSGPMLATAFGELHKSARVLFMSGYTDETIIRYGVLQGQVPFLEKPYTPENLTEKVRAILA